MKRFITLFLLLALVLTPVCLSVSDAETTDTDAEVTEADETETPDLPELTASVSLDGDLFITSDTFTVTVSVTASALRGGTAKIEFDGSKLKAASVSYTEEEGVKLYHSISDGSVSMVFYTNEPCTKTFHLADITFTATDGKDNEVMTVNLTEAYATDGKNEIPAKLTGYKFVLINGFYTDQTTEDITETETDTDTDTKDVTDTTDQDVTTDEPPVTDETAETDKDPQTVTEKAPVTEGTTSKAPDTRPHGDDTDKITDDTNDQTSTVSETGTEKTDASGTDEVTDTDTEPYDVTETDKEPPQTYTDITDGETTANNKPLGIPISMPVIISLIGVAAAGAAVGAVFLIRRAVKAKKEKSE